MFSLSSKLFFLLIFNSILNESVAVTLECTFRNLSWNDAENLYSCNIENNGIFDGSRLRIDSLENQLPDNMTNDDVMGINTYSRFNMSFIPENLAEIFKNLKAIGLSDANLQEITQRDLKPFRKLKYLFLYSNKIKSIEMNLFQFNPELTQIMLNNNEISNIDPYVFDYLDNLVLLDLVENNCKTTFDYTSNRSSVLNVIDKIRKGECSSRDISEMYKDLKVAYDLAFNNLTQMEIDNENCVELNQNNSLTFNDIKSNLTSTVIEQGNVNHELNEKNKNLLKNLTELQEKYDELLASKNLYAIEKLTAYEKTINELNTRIYNLIDKMNDLHDKYENLLHDKLVESHKINEKLMQQMKSLKNVENEI